MRTIKFRGKSIDNGKWFYGNLAIYHEYSKKLKQNIAVYYINGGGYGSEGKVDPKTIGQYIEKQDKNKVEIYEGDIVYFNNEDTFKEYKNIGHVFFKSEILAFQIKYINDNWTYDIDEWQQGHITIIGNIYENPELLEVNDVKSNN